MSSLAASAEAKALEELASQVASENAKSLFAIGGTIPVNALDNHLICESDEARSDGHHSADESNATGMEIWEISDDEDNPQQEEPKGDVHRMRCDPVTIRWDSDHGAGCKVTLPCADVDRPDFEQLLKDCQPASFGRGGEDVLDESYRKAGKIDESAFCSNLNPYALGIVDTAAQALAPKLAHQTNESHGLRAELYKLNVYSSPSDKFKAHVDTPRSKRQWAAFYSDCEHEVLEVTSGHRVTLTYNLYATCWTNTAWLEPEQVELYRTLRRLASEPGFCKDGVTLGYHCAHAYPHTEKEIINTLPATLKGVDKVVFECFFATDFDVSLRHMLDLPTVDDFGYGETPIECLLGMNQDHDPNQPPQHLANMFEWVENDYARWKCNKWRIKKEFRHRGDLAVLANRLEPLRLSDAGMWEELSSREMVEEWTSNYKVECVKWLNDPSQHQPALLHGAYGNQPEIDIKYSSLVITMVIPPFHMR